VVFWRDIFSSCSCIDLPWHYTSKYWRFRREETLHDHPGTCPMSLALCSKDIRFSLEVPWDRKYTSRIDWQHLRLTAKGTKATKATVETRAIARWDVLLDDEQNCRDVVSWSSTCFDTLPLSKRHGRVPCDGKLKSASAWSLCLSRWKISDKQELTHKYSKICCLLVNSAAWVLRYLIACMSSILNQKVCTRSSLSTWHYVKEYFGPSPPCGVVQLIPVVC
jgi:hypothetical protein